MFRQAKDKGLLFFLPAIVLLHFHFLCMWLRSGVQAETQLARPFEHPQGVLTRGAPPPQFFAYERRSSKEFGTRLKLHYISSTRVKTIFGCSLNHVKTKKQLQSFCRSHNWSPSERPIGLNIICLHG